MAEASSESKKTLGIKSIYEAAKEEYNYIEARKEGRIRSLKTPWKKFNMAGIDGIEWGSINVIAGMSGSGKTSIISQLETGLFQENPSEDFAVLSFNFEMLARRLVGRKVSQRLQKPVKGLYSADRTDTSSNISDEELKYIKDYMARELKDLPIYYVDMPGTVDEIENTIKQFNQRSDIKHRPFVVTLDHSILIKPSMSQADERNTLMEFSVMMNRLKKELNCSFVVLSQLNRDIESVDRKRNEGLHYPQKSDVFGGDSLYQFSDLFLISHRPEILNLEYYGPDKMPVENMVYWHFIKCRDGEPFIAQMCNDLKNNRIVEVESQEQEF